MPIMNTVIKGAGGGGSSTKLGVSIDNIIGDTVGGVLSGIGNNRISTFDMTGIVTVNNWALEHTFQNSSSFALSWALSAPDLEEVKDSGFYYTFYGSPAYILGSISFPKLKTVGIEAFDHAFATTSGASSLTIADFSAVETIASGGFKAAFQYQGLQKVYFTGLTSIASDAFGTANASYAFRSCLNLSEIHFPAAMQATIEAMSGYSVKWGATDATIYFDL